MARKEAKSIKSRRKPNVLQYVGYLLAFLGIIYYLNYGFGKYSLSNISNIGLRILVNVFIILFLFLLVSNLAVSLTPKEKCELWKQSIKQVPFRELNKKVKIVILGKLSFYLIFGIIAILKEIFYPDNNIYSIAIVLAVGLIFLFIFFYIIKKRIWEKAYYTHLNAKTDALDFNKMQKDIEHETYQIGEGYNYWCPNCDEGFQTPEEALKHKC